MLVARRPNAVRVQPCKRIKLSALRFARPNPMQICACAWIYRWTKNLDTEPPGLRAVSGRGPPDRGGPRAAGRGPMGLRAAGPLGRRGPWAAGLLLAKPIHLHVRKLNLLFVNVVV